MENSNGTTRVLRMKDLPQKTSCQPSTIYGYIAEGKFPRSFKLVEGGRASGWLESTIDQWLQERSTSGAKMSPADKTTVGAVVAAPQLCALTASSMKDRVGEVATTRQTSKSGARYSLHRVTCSKPRQR